MLRKLGMIRKKISSSCPEKNKMLRKQLHINTADSNSLDFGYTLTGRVYILF